MQPSRLRAEFIAPHSLEECVSRLYTRNEPHNLMEYRLCVNLEQIDSDTYRLHIQEIHGLPSKPHDWQDQALYKLVGGLKRLPDGRTAVYTRVVMAELQVYIAITGFLIMLAIILYFIPFPYNLALGMIVLGSIPLAYGIFQRSWRSAMLKKIAMLRETLS